MKQGKEKITNNITKKGTFNPDNKAIASKLNN